MATTTYRTITLDRAKLAIKVYNEGMYGCVKNPDLDERAREMFAGGLDLRLAHAVIWAIAKRMNGVVAGNVHDSQLPNSA